MVTIICFIAAVFGFSLAWWQHRDASHAKLALASTQRDLPAIIDAAAAIITTTQAEVGTLPAPSQGWVGRTDYIDVNGDGREELLIQYPTGAHGSQLAVLGWRGSRFECFARLGTGTPVGFEFGDFDGDGKIEVKTQELDSGSGLPYVSAPRTELLLRWNGTGFVEVSRREVLD